MQSVKCGVRSASVSEVRSAKFEVPVKFEGSLRLAWRCIAKWSQVGQVLGQQCDKFAQSTHAHAWLAHDTCNFYRWQRLYSISLRQLPPCLVRVLLVYEARISVKRVFCEKMFARRGLRCQ